jgi:hypothetical protein
VVIFFIFYFERLVSPRGYWDKAFSGHYKGTNPTHQCTPFIFYFFLIFLRRKDIVRVTNIVMIIFMCSLISLFLPFDVRYWVLTPLISVESSIMILYVP